MFGEALQPLLHWCLPREPRVGKDAFLEVGVFGKQLGVDLSFGVQARIVLLPVSWSADHVSRAKRPAPVGVHQPNTDDRDAEDRR